MSLQLLKTLPALQNQLDALLEFDVSALFLHFHELKFILAL